MDSIPTKAKTKNPMRRFFIFGSLFFLFPLYVHAASIYILPAEQSVSVGQTFTLTAYVSSPDQAMNAASGDISFTSDKLQVLSISKENSVMNLWIRDPSFTNSISGGNVYFEGVVLNPGFVGTAGNLIAVTFQAVEAGNASISFSSGAVLANDGNGTNILNSTQGDTVTIGPRIPIPSADISSTSLSSTTSSVTSTTIPTTTPAIPKETMPLKPSNMWQQWIPIIVGWGLAIILGLLLVAGIIFLSFAIIYGIRKWRVSSEHDLLKLEEVLLNDLKRIEKELRSEKNTANDTFKKTIEQAELDIEKDISKIENAKKE